MQKPSEPLTQQLHTANKSAFSGKAEVAILEDSVQVEIRDLDEMTTCEEVVQAVYAEEECDIPAGAAPRMRNAYGVTQTAKEQNCVISDSQKCLRTQVFKSCLSHF